MKSYASCTTILVVAWSNQSIASCPVWWLSEESFWKKDEKCLVLIWSTSEGWKAKSTLDPPSDYELRTLDWKSITLTTRPLLLHDFRTVPVGIYLLKVNNRITRTMCEICSKLTINTLVLLLTWNIFHTLFQCFYC